MKFIPKGPERYAHQKRGLRKLIETKGVCALLFEPGLGKTMTVLDFASILAIKNKIDGKADETRVLVACPLVAVDTWVIQSEQYVSDQVAVWAEVVGGSIMQKGEALASRGGRPFKTPKKEDKRAVHTCKALARHIRPGNGTGNPLDGPEVALGDDLPRLVIEVINLDALSSRARRGSQTMADYMVEAIRGRYSPEVVVVDEMHKIKGVSSNVSMLMARVGSGAPRRIGLTGTVMPKGPIDVYAQWRFLAPTVFGAPDGKGGRKVANLGVFKTRFAQLGGYMGREVIGYKNLDEMEKLMAENSVIARKADALDLPEVTEVVVPVRLSAAEKTAYSTMASSLQVDLGGEDKSSAVNRLARLMRLRQITSGHIKNDDGEIVTIGNSKVKTIDGIVNDILAGERRVVVFCMFTAEIAALRVALKRAGTEVMVADGSTPKKTRIEYRKRFGSDDPTRMILLAQIQTMSMAVNELVTSSNAVFGSLSQLRDEVVQARDRVHRIGQKRPVTFWYALAPSTVDEVIMDSHKSRTDLEKAMLHHIHSGEWEE